ncbi:RcpC/CpaB family pilus assembly protein [Fodinicola feengrottensis]|uniref:RcpC/CpaB family pilus assembly protein n=1 Tax=Fodinicola feengrottensis TaxID=435914 RepID=UPI0031D66FA7
MGMFTWTKRNSGDPDLRPDRRSWRFWVRLPRPGRVVRPAVAAALVCLAGLVLLAAGPDPVASQPSPTPSAPRPRLVPPGQVGLTVEIGTSAAQALQVGDRIDVLAATQPGGSATAVVVASDAQVLAVRAADATADHAEAIFIAIPPDAAARIAAIPTEARITVAVLSR